MIDVLLIKLETLIILHRKNDDMWVDFFEDASAKIQKDAAFGCEFLTMGWHGIGSYDDAQIFNNDADEATRRDLHPQIYKMAMDIKNASH